MMQVVRILELHIGNPGVWDLEFGVLDLESRPGGTSFGF